MFRAGLILTVIVAIGGGIAFMQWQRGTEDPVAGMGGPGRPSPNVIVAPAISRTATEFIESVGTARANQAVTLTSKVTGRLEQIRFTDGQLVSEGQILVTLDARELAAELETAKANLRQAQNDFERAQSLRGSQAVSEARVDELRATLDGAAAQVNVREARLQEFTITAPFAGTTGVNRLSKGALVDPNTQIVTLDDLSIIKVDFSIPETAMQKVQLGDRVIARSRALGTQTYEGRIQSLDTRVDPVNRSIGAVAVFDNSDGALRPGMFLNLSTALEQRLNAVFVAEEALVPTGSRQFVYVVTDGIVERREVQVGQRVPGLVEVLDGVAKGETVVVRGVQFMRDGVTVNIIDTIEPGTVPDYRPS